MRVHLPEYASCSRVVEKAQIVPSEQSAISDTDDSPLARVIVVVTSWVTCLFILLFPFADSIRVAGVVPCA